MRGVLKYLIPAGVLAAAGVPLILLIPNTELLVAGIMAVFTAIILIFTALARVIGKRTGKRLSGWRLFAIGDLILLALALVMFAIFREEMLGAVMVFAFPMLGALLVLEWLLWRMSKMVSTGNDEREEHTHEH